ncbi:MAG: hypothetical protein JEZ07_10795 [Phycisphaerae bacterium]|nr:hypothetical protein [Phycisphaerae bacterium]
MTELTSLERVIRAVTHQKVDRIPLDIGASYTTGITKNAYCGLAKAMGAVGIEPQLFDVVQQLAVVDDQMAELIKVDIRGIAPNVIRKNPAIEIIDGVQCFTDEWGLKWIKEEGVLYFHHSNAPLGGEITEKEIEEFPWPDPTDPKLFDGVVDQAKQYHQQGYAVILESICSGIFEMSCRLRGTEQFYMDLALNPDLACALLDKLVEIKIKYYKVAAKAVGQYVQFIREADDVAGQESLLMSQKMYRQLIKPRHKMLFDAQNQEFPEPFFIWFHSDGAIYDILGDFIEIGVQVLNPLQLTAKGMDAEKIKSEFGKDLAFWGGGVNTQHILPHCGPEDVGDDVQQRIKTIGPEGFIFGTVHNIQDDVPTANIMAMLEKFEKMKHVVDN